MRLHNKRTNRQGRGNYTSNIQPGYLSGLVYSEVDYKKIPKSIIMQFNQAVVPYQQPPQQYVPYNAMQHTINIDSYKVEANDSVINGNSNVIFGNNNTIFGNSNKIYGNNNKVVGNDNSVKGEGNAAEGARNDVSSPFGSMSQDPSTPFGTTNNIPSDTPFSEPASIPRNTPMNAYPATTRARSNTFPIAAPTPYPMANDYQMATSPTFITSSSVSPYAIVPVPAPSPYAQAIVPVAMQLPVYQQVVPYVNPFAAQVNQPNPFEAHKNKEKEVDLIQDGTMVFMIKEWESDYVREFCQLVQMNSGQKVGHHVSCGRTCIVAFGDLEKVRRAIIDLLPQLNMRLKEWSWNSFGNKVCHDRELFEKRLFQEYKKEDVECWRNNSGNNTTSATKAAA